MAGSENSAFIAVFGTVSLSENFGHIGDAMRSTIAHFLVSASGIGGKKYSLVEVRLATVTLLMEVRGEDGGEGEGEGESEKRILFCTPQGFL